MDTGAGMVTFDSPVTVAKVVSDTDVHESGVQVNPSYGQPKYQASPQPPVICIAQTPTIARQVHNSLVLETWPQC